MAMGIRRPGFQQLSLVPPTSHGASTFADSPCLLPDQLAIYLSVYIPFLLLSLLIVLLSNIIRTRVFPLGGSADSHSRIPESAPTSLSSAPLSRKVRLRQEVERDDEQMPYEYSPDPDSPTEYPGLTLPPPVSARSKKKQPHWFTKSFVLLGRRRRITIGAMSLKSMWKVGSKGRKQRGFLGGCIRDVRDVAVFPLAVFVLVSGWMCI